MDKRRGIGSDSPAKDRAGYTGALPGYRKGLSGIRKACLICQHLFDPLENLVQQYQRDPEILLQSLQQAADEASS